MRHFLLSSVAALAVVGFSGAAFAGGGCSGYGQHSSETAQSSIPAESDESASSAQTLVASDATATGSAAVETTSEN